MNTKTRAVLCVETGEIFDSAHKAGIAKKIPSSNIRRACKSRRATAAGHHWTYNLELPEEERSKIINLPPFKRKVLCIETGEVFDSAWEAGKVKKVGSSSIALSCDFGIRAAGYHWTYNLELTKEEGHEIVNSLLQKRWNKVLCIETEEVFNSAREAAEAKKISPQHIRRACRLSTAIAAGCHWTYNIGLTEEESAKIIKHTSPTAKRRVLCVETEEIFDSSYDAGKAKKINRATVWYGCKTGKMSGGYHWSYNIELTEEERQKINELKLQVNNSQNLDNFIYDLAVFSILESLATIKFVNPKAPRAPVIRASHGGGV